MPLKETALLFGAGKNLVGVITDPAALSGPPSRPVVVLLNAGLLHRVGPNRLYVKLARRLAGEGFVVARFDQSGIGDSPKATEPSGFEGRAVAETRACMDLLASSRGAREFVLAGLCSGADYSLLVAAQDPRVAGMVLIDPASAPSTGQVIDSYRTRLLSPRSWIRLLTGQSEAWSLLTQRLRSRRKIAAPPPAPAVESVSPGIRMRQFAERGGSLCLVFSEGNPAHYNFRTALTQQIGNVPDGRLRVEVVAETDHIFTPLDAQRRLLDAVCDWASGLRLSDPPPPAERS